MNISTPAWYAGLALLMLAPASHARGADATDAAFPVSITVSANRPLGPLRPIWRFFGADEPNYATMKDGQKLLAEQGKLRPGEVYFRAHNLLTSGDGTPALKWGSTNAYTEDAQGRPVYDWTIVDRIFDSYLARGLRPYVQIGFMPQALSVKPEPYRHEWRPGLGYDIGTGWSYPPKDYAKWAELVYQWVLHCVQKYGRGEVEHWYFEVWNEANYPAYWHATPVEFYKLHDYAIDAVRRALPTARVGGPDVAGHGGEFSQAFFEHCLRGTNYATGQPGTPLDFVSFHAKGAPTYVDGHVRMGIAAQLRTIDRGFELIAGYPELRQTPIVIGESDPEGCAACQGPQLGYRNGTMYSSYTAATFAREHDLAARRGVNLEGALTWAFEFEDQPYFAGFRALATNGIPLPVLNVFRMFAKMDGQRVASASSAATPLDVLLADGVRAAPDVAALASVVELGAAPHGPDHSPRSASLEAATGQLAALVWHYHDDDVAGPDAAVQLTFEGLPAVTQARVTHYRIDENHSNAFAAWRRMGAPIAPSSTQYAELLKASELVVLAEAPATTTVTNGRARLSFALPRQAVSLVVLDWEASPASR